MLNSFPKHCKFGEMMEVVLELVQSRCACCRNGFSAQEGAQEDVDWTRADAFIEQKPRCVQSMHRSEKGQGEYFVSNISRMILSL